MKIHLAWIRAAAVALATVVAGAQTATAQYAPYRPNTPQPVVTPAAPQQTPAVQAPYAPYTAYRTQPQYPAPATTYSPAATTYQSPMATQYGQPTSAYPQYPQTAAQYSASTVSNPYLAQQPVKEMPAPRQNDSAAQMNGNATMNGTTMSGSMSATQGGAGCNCNGSASYTGAACGCYTGCNSDYGISNYFNNDSCNENQWFGGIYFLEMGRTNQTPVKLTVQVDHTVAPDPYYPQPPATFMTTRDVNFDFREGVEVRFGSTFTIGDSCSSCQSGCNGYGYGYNCNTSSGCGNCGPATTYAWEAAWWGLNNNDSEDMVAYTGGNRIYGMKNFVGLQYDRDGAGGAYTYNPVNSYYGYQLPIPAPPGPPPADGYIRVLAQRVRTDFQAQNLELNVIRFPVCNAGCGGCNGGAAGCNGCDGSLASSCGCNDSCGLGFSMYGSCGVRYFHIHDYLNYDTEFGEASGGAYDQAAYNGFTFDNSNELCYDVDVKNNLVGPQLGWTNDYCWGKWNLFLNSTFGIFDNHISAFQRVWSGGGGTVVFTGDGSAASVSSHKDQVSFLGELRAGVAYDISCHWRGVVAYRAVAITGLATAADQMPSEFTNRTDVAIINSDNSTIIHGAQVGAECRY
jgi:hypothetical protein